MNRAKIAGVAAAIIVAVMYLFCFWVTPKPCETLEQHGLFGDSFGAINTLFTGLALAGVVAALFYQHVEIDEFIRQQDETIKWQKLQIRLQVLSAATVQLRETAVELQDKMEHVKKPTITSVKTGEPLNASDEYIDVQTQLDTTFARLLALASQTEQEFEQVLKEAV